MARIRTVVLFGGQSSEHEISCLSALTVIGALEMLLQLHRRSMPRRTGQDRELVERAKAILMKQLQLTEPEAHHLLQKQAMDRGIRMTEYAARIIQKSRASTGPEDAS